VNTAQWIATDSTYLNRAINVTPHVTQNNGVGKTGKRRCSAVDERTTRHDGYGNRAAR
jgi:hypothetical protein